MSAKIASKSYTNEPTAELARRQGSASPATNLHNVSTR